MSQFKSLGDPVVLIVALCDPVVTDFRVLKCLHRLLECNIFNELKQEIENFSKLPRRAKV